MASRIKPIEFLGSSLTALRAFPVDARRMAGFQLDRVQRGLDPPDWKPMPSVGPGAREIRVRDESGAYRVLFVSTTAGTVCVVHCFQKKTRRTSRLDLEIARTRFRQLMRVQG